MATSYVNIDRETALLLPPDLRDWVPADHVVHFVIDAVEELDLSAARGVERGPEREQFPPGMLAALLIFSYATGTFSSRQIQRSTYENVAVRLLCADTHPDLEILCTFRRENGVLLSACFAQVLELAAGCGVSKVGRITVAIEGTKVLAHASKLASGRQDQFSHAMPPVEQEIAQLLRIAEEADMMALPDGLMMPAQVCRRQERKAQLTRARAEMEARASARFRDEQAEHFARMAARGVTSPLARRPWVRRPELAESFDGPKEAFELTDAERRLIKAGSSEYFEMEQAFCWAAAEVISR